MINESLQFSKTAKQVLKERYLLKNNSQKVIETPDEMFNRVAKAVSSCEKNFSRQYKPSQIQEIFYNIMKDLEFLPNSPTLMNAGTSIGQLSACFVLPIEDSMDGIFNALKSMAKIHQTGGGTGFNFSNLRPKGSLVESTKGQASGVVSFMSIFDQATGVIMQGGRRRGANMGILNCDHPDIFDFVNAKNKPESFSNFNLSVAVSDKFMRSVIKKHKKCADLFDLIVENAYKTADPGLIFIDEINRKNTVPGAGKIQATNPCGELPLLPYESCNLGSINLSKVVINKKVDWQKLKYLIKFGIRFLDNVIQINKYPLPQIRDITFANRKIGLGIMGFADMLIKLDTSYNSPKAVYFASTLMKFIKEHSIKASVELAKERGVFPNFKKSVYAKKGLKLRNATLNTIAPTGTISIIAGCSSGIEPVFSAHLKRKILSKKKFKETHALAKEPAFITAFDVAALQHLKIQAAFQKCTDNSVSKTINLPKKAAKKHIRNIYLKAWQLKCKGITIYRYGTKKDQVLSFEQDKTCLPGIC